MGRTNHPVESSQFIEYRHLPLLMNEIWRLSEADKPYILTLSMHL